MPTAQSAERLWVPGPTSAGDLPSLDQAPGITALLNDRRKLVDRDRPPGEILVERVDDPLELGAQRFDISSLTEVRSQLAQPFQACFESRFSRSLGSLLEWLGDLFVMLAKPRHTTIELQLCQGRSRASILRKTRVGRESFLTASPAHRPPVPACGVLIPPPASVARW